MSGGRNREASPRSTYALAADCGMHRALRMRSVSSAQITATQSTWMSLPELRRGPRSRRSIAFALGVSLGPRQPDRGRGAEQQDHRDQQRGAGAEHERAAAEERAEQRDAEHAAGL